MTISEATSAAQRWLYDLQIGKPTGKWAIGGTPALRGGLWNMQCTSPDRLATLQISATDGDLVLLSTWTRSGPLQVAAGLH